MLMKQPRRIDFTLIFDASDGLWSSLAMFEGDMVTFLKDKSIEATMVKNIDGKSAQYTLVLSKIEQIVNFTTQRPISPKKQVINVKKEINSGLSDRSR